MWGYFNKVGTVLGNSQLLPTETLHRCCVEHLNQEIHEFVVVA